MVDYARETTQRAVVIGGGLLGLEAARGLQSYGLQVDVVHAGRHLMNAQLDPQAARSCGGAWRSSASSVLTRPAPPRSWARTRSAACGCADGRIARLRHGGRRRRHPAQRRARRDQRVHRGARHRGRRPDATIDDADVYAVGECVQHRGEVVRAGRAAVGAGRGAGRPDHRRDPTPPTTGRGPRPSSRWPASTSPRWGCTEPERDDDEHMRVLRAEPRRLQVASSSATTSSSAPRCSATVSKVAFLMQAFDRGLPLPEERVRAAVRPRRARRREVGVAETRRRRAGLQLQRRQQGRDWSRAWRAACKTRRRR